MPIEYVVRLILAVVVIWVWLRRVKQPIRYAFVTVGMLNIVFILTALYGRALFSNQDLNFISILISIITLSALIALAGVVKRG